MTIYEYKPPNPPYGRIMKDDRFCSTNMRSCRYKSNLRYEYAVCKLFRVKVQERGYSCYGPDNIGVYKSRHLRKV